MSKTYLHLFCFFLSYIVLTAVAPAAPARDRLGNQHQAETDITRRRADEAAQNAELATARAQAAEKATSALVQPNAVAEPTPVPAVKPAKEQLPETPRQPTAEEQRQAELEIRLKAEQTARKKAEEDSLKKLAELEARLQAEREEAARAVTETQKRLAELETRLQAEQEARKMQAEKLRQTAVQDKVDPVVIIESTAPVTAEAPAKRRATFVNPFKSQEKGGEESNHEYTITAERMEMANNVIELHGNVKIEDDTMLMTATKMMVYLQDSDANTDRLEKAEAFGAVTIRKLDGDESATGDRGVFDKVQGTIVLDGNCTLMQGKNVMQCRTIIYDLNSQKIKAIGATLNLQTGKGAGGPAGFFGQGGAASKENSETDTKK